GSIRIPPRSAPPARRRSPRTAPPASSPPNPSTPPTSSPAPRPHPRRAPRPRRCIIPIEETEKSYAEEQRTDRFPAASAPLRESIFQYDSTRDERRSSEE